MQNNQEQSKKLVSFRVMAFVGILVLFCVFIVFAFQNPLVGNLNEPDCIEGATECVVKDSKPFNYLFWAGVYLCSFLGLILMTFKPGRLNKRPSAYLSLGAAAAVNTVTWMGLVYVGAYFVKFL